MIQLHRGLAPLIVAFPHTGTDLAGMEERLRLALARAA